MKMSNFKKKVKQEEFDIPDVREKIVNSNEFKNRSYEKEVYKSPLYKRNALRVCFGVLIIALIIPFIITSFGKQKTERVVENKLGYVKNEAQLEELLTYDEERVSLWDSIFAPIFKGGMAKNDMMLDEAAPAPAAPAPTDEPNDMQNSYDMSNTNNQVENVDEADIVKSDGARIYRVSNGKLYVNAIENGVISETKTISLVDDELRAYGEMMYLTDKYVVVIFKNSVDWDFSEYKYYGYRYNSSKVSVRVYDKENLELKKSYDKVGTQLVDSRIVNGSEDVLYLIINSSIEKERNNYELPVDYIDNVKHKYDYSDICYFDNLINKQYTTIVSIKLSDEIKVESKIQLSCYWTATYVTENSIYLTNSTYCYTYNNSMNTNFGDEWSCVTVIVKYEIDEGKITPIATTTTTGEVKDQFYLSEKDGYLRVALSQKDHNKVEIYSVEKDEFDNNYFKLVGKVDEGLGEPREEIKSVSFNGDYCLVVTAKSTDPMYKIDLTDPTNPVILGKFKEDGYNSYLQYLTGDLEGLAFGLGYLTHDISEEYNVRDGSKLGLYDVTGDNPVQLDLITYTSSYGVEATYNHKALFVYKDYIGFTVDGIYYLYQIVKNGESYKFEEVLKYDILEITDDVDDYYTINVNARMYYINGYFYIGYVDYLKNYDYKVNGAVVSFDSNFDLIQKVN